MEIDQLCDRDLVTTLAASAAFWQLHHKHEETAETVAMLDQMDAAMIEMERRTAVLCKRCPIEEV